MLRFIFFNDTSTTEIYTLSLHDALPISPPRNPARGWATRSSSSTRTSEATFMRRRRRSEEHTSELQSHSDLVCRLLLEKKKKKRYGGRRVYEHSSSRMRPCMATPGRICP